MATAERAKSEGCLKIKIEVEAGLFRKFEVPDGNTFSAISETIKRICQFNVFRLFYVDQEGDDIIIECEEEFVIACRQFGCDIEDPSEGGTNGVYYGGDKELRFYTYDKRNRNTPKPLFAVNNNKNNNNNNNNSNNNNNIRNAFFSPNNPPQKEQHIYETTRVKIKSATKDVCLDIGGAAVTNVVDSLHDSNTTRLVFKRLDGPSFGAVSTAHVFGIFTEDGQTRLDIGIRAMKKEIPMSHDSWATLLYVKRLGEQPKPVGFGVGFPIQYGEVVGVFSQSNNKRLDVGAQSLKEAVPASHDSWATRLKIVPK
mmetsp:Transcript_17271/g.26995  ORF Transcript_17271/g.26995 Transcript_17271/m.26995 type:complete len:312 (-) Transcript_17271:63-998(-)